MPRARVKFRWSDRPSFQRNGLNVGSRAHAPEVLLPAAALPPAVVPDLARIGMLALPGSLSVALAEWDRLGEDERENAAAEVRRLAMIVEGGGRGA